MIKNTIEEDVCFYTDKIICARCNKDIENIIYEILFNKRKYQIPRKITQHRLKIIDHNKELLRIIKNNKREINYLKYSNKVFDLERFKETDEYKNLLSSLKKFKDEQDDEYNKRLERLNEENKKFKEETTRHLRDIIARNDELFRECRMLYVQNEKLKNNDQGEK